MKLSSIALGSLAAWLPLGLAQEARQPTAHQSPGQPGLQRVAPEPADPLDAVPGFVDDPRELARVFSKDFERTEWIARLAEANLDQRERSFDLLLRRARLDPVARAFLEDQARDPNGGELAWTARMALRQLGHASLPLQFMLPGTDPFGPARRMQQMLEQLMAETGQGFHFPMGVPVTPSPGGSAGRSVHFEQDGQGARIRIVERIDGQEVTRSYEGENLEAILRAHPELDSELSVPRSFGGWEPSQPLVPQGRSRPIITDRLGVIVQPIDATRAQELGLVEQGLRVERTYPETYAQLLGVGAGSILLELDGRKLATAADIENAMRARGPDDPLRLVWLDELGQRQEKTWKVD